MATIAYGNDSRSENKRAAMALGNMLLSQLPAAEMDAISPLLTRSWLAVDQTILGVEERPDFLYFPESAIISVIACGSNGRNSYVGLYGHEGFGSTCAVLGAPTSPAAEVVQSAGYAYSVRTLH